MLWLRINDVEPMRSTHPHSNTAEPSCLLTHWHARLLLWQVEIFTGRPHQIRIHMAAMGHPLVGDPLYGVGGVPKVRRTVGCGGCRGQHMRTWGHVGNGLYDSCSGTTVLSSQHTCTRAAMAGYGRPCTAYMGLKDDQNKDRVLWGPIAKSRRSLQAGLDVAAALAAEDGAPLPEGPAAGRASCSEREGTYRYAGRPGAC